MRTFNLILTTFFVFVIACCILKTAPVSSTTSAEDSIDLYIKARMKEKGIPGVALAIVRDGKPVLIRSYGKANLELDLPVTPKTSYQIASVGKLITSTAVLKLVKDGKLRLEDKVSQYIPNTPESWSNITIAHLASHQSGIRMIPFSKVKTLAEAIDSARVLSLDYPTGSRQAYLSSDYILLMHIIEKVSGKTFQQYLKEDVFKPLKMNQSGFGYNEDTPEILQKKAAVYVGAGDTMKADKFFYAPVMYAAGGVYASLDDMVKWIAALDNETMFTKQEQQQFFYSPARYNDGKESDFSKAGWIIYSKEWNRQAAGHTGGPALADLIRFPEEKLTVLVLTNQRRLLPGMAKGVMEIWEREQD